MTIKDEHIREAEGLLINDNRFDEKERIPFIKNLSTIDLLAVPGSGKTTALQAKLYCLSKQLPFDDGSGILVLSHTNAAVEEIEKNLKKLCPKLFEYPNFVGTVQSFVNKFLANNGNYLLNGSYLSIVDNDFANKRIIDMTSRLSYDNSLSKYLFFQTYNQCASISRRRLMDEYKISEEDSKDVVSQLKKINIIKNGALSYTQVRSYDLVDAMPIKSSIKTIVKDIHKKAKKETNLTKNQRSSYYSVDYINSKFSYTQLLGFDSDSGKELNKIFTDNFQKGIARFRDCYSLASWYIHNYPAIKLILQNRFKYVFIDETQDLEDYQINLIDDIFFNEDSHTIIQRVGDVNQSIFSGGKSIKLKADWEPRENCFYLTGSNRLTPKIAELVNCFTLDPQKDENKNPLFVVNGLKDINVEISPHLILFDEDTKKQLEDAFKVLIQKYSLTETIEGNKYGYKIIGWNSKWNDEEVEHSGKLRLEDIFEKFKKEKNEKKEHLNSLSKYLQCFDENRKTLKHIQDNIINVFLSILKLQNQTIILKRKEKINERYYTKRDLLSKIKSTPVNYSLFQQKLYIWCFSLSTKRNHSEVYASIKGFIEKDFIKWFDLTLSAETKVFLGKRFEPIKAVISKSQQLPSSDSITIDIGTVHSAKGQTHCATMYVETSFYKYETEKLKVSVKEKKNERILNNPLFKKTHEYYGETYSHAKMTIKMMYVGFSRPTHLLCFACLKENVCDDINQFRDAGWEIVDTTEDSQK